MKEFENFDFNNYDDRFDLLEKCKLFLEFMTNNL